MLLRRLVVAILESVPRLARLAARLDQQRVAAQAGFARTDDFARERFGRSGRWLRDLAALGARLDALPELEVALRGADGGPPLGAVAALAIARHLAPRATATTKDAGMPTREPAGASHPSRELAGWIARARQCSVRELRAALRAAKEEEASTAQCPPSMDGTAPRGRGEESHAAARTQPVAARPDEEHERVLVRIRVPTEVHHAFDEVRDLHEALAGGRTAAEGFVEALLGEVVSSGLPSPPDVAVVPARAGNRRARREGMGDAARWEDHQAATHAPGTNTPIGRSPATRRALEILEALRDRAALPEHNAAGVTSNGAPSDLLARFTRQLELAEAVERCIGALLAELEDLGSWTALGFDDLGHYAEARLRMARSTARERATLARRLRRLPRVRAAYETGVLHLEAAKIVARAVHGEESSQLEERECRWTEAGCQRTVKRLRDELRVLRGRERSEGGANTPLDDATWFASLRRAPGRSRDRVLRAGFEMIGRVQRSERRRAPIGTDGFLRFYLPEPVAHDFIAGIETCRQALEAGSRGSEVSLEEAALEARRLPSMRLARAFSIRGLRVPAWLGLLAWLEDVVLEWDHPARVPRHAEQAVYVRDGWRCAAPGCTSRSNLESHHVVYRSRGGSNDLDNRITLCRFHHQWGEHGGRLQVRGRAPLGLHWRLGRAALATSYRNERRIA